MSTIRIERLTDSHDCETCGMSWAEGARVFVDGELAIELSPNAHCYDGDNFADDVVYRRVLEHLGHTVTWDGE